LLSSQTTAPVKDNPDNVREGGGMVILKAAFTLSLIKYPGQTSDAFTG